MENRCSVCNTPRANSSQCQRCLEIKNRFTCKECGKGFKFQCHLKTHETQVHQKVLRLVPCSAIGCKSSFKYKGDMLEHPFVGSTWDCTNANIVNSRVVVLQN